jgi:sugar/nucleoside kinase (ribokinase family)
MTITVIGHLCLDVIHPKNGPDSHSYGGIFFSVATLANLLGPEDRVRPVFGVGRQEYDALIERLQEYPNIDPSGIYRFSGPTNRVELTYSTASERSERSVDISEPIAWKRIRPAIAETDMILVNMISGLDLTLETLDEIRMAVREDKTPVYLDVHSLTLGITNDFVRFHRPVDSWRRWLFMLHGIHLNEEEAAAISSEPLTEDQFATHALALNTQVLHITRGERGCSLFINIHKVIQKTDIPAVDPSMAKDPTGCGDVFTAAYCAHYAKHRDIPAATQFANQVAGFKAQLVGSNRINELSRFRLGEQHEVEGQS